jgi:hypothetical protein
MDTPRDRRHDDSRSDGFVLVGVVMFVLALTILGLSVFSLSSYEAQFLRNSQDEVMAYNDAMSGMARAGYIVATRGRLDSCRVVLPVNIDSTRAWDLTGKQDGAPTTQDIWIKVAASHGTARKSVVGRFTLKSDSTFYKRALHSAGSVVVDIQSGATNHTVQLGDAVRLGVNSWSWLYSLRSPLPSDYATVVIPVPSVSPFIASHWASATQPPYDMIHDRVYLTNPSNSSVKYFRWPEYTPARQYTLEANGPTIEVEGPVVWMFPRGVKFEYAVKIESHGHHHSHGNDDCLVIVAGPGDELESGIGYIGIQFHGGLESADVPVILVTDGALTYNQENSSGNSYRVDYFSAFVGGAYLRGPTVGNSVQFLHDHDAPEDDRNGIIDRLISQGALPNAVSTTGSRYELVAGTWQDVTP